MTLIAFTFSLHYRAAICFRSPARWFIGPALAAVLLMNWSMAQYNNVSNRRPWERPVIEQRVWRYRAPDKLSKAVKLIWKLSCCLISSFTQPEKIKKRNSEGNKCPKKKPLTPHGSGLFAQSIFKLLLKSSDKFSLQILADIDYMLKIRQPHWAVKPRPGSNAK